MSKTIQLKTKIATAHREVFTEMVRDQFSRLPPSWIYDQDREKVIQFAESFQPYKELQELIEEMKNDNRA